MPLPPSASGLVERAEAAALLRIVDLACGPAAPARRLSEIFGLSQAEARLAADLLAGKQPEEIAGRRGVKISTIRTQLRAVFTKTGTARQAELLRLLMRVAGPEA